ncbi:MAG: cobalt transporter CbiM [Thermacetogeniaceae bacterium]
MHIPDGYLGPATCVVGYVVMLPFWATAVKKVKETLQTRLIPLMVIGAAFSFVLMMFNVPIPDGTTAHAVGSSLLAIILGPWAAMICVTIALAIQALLFGDGGITAFGFNCFNMAVVIPFSAYFIYRLIAGNSEATSAKRWIGGLVGGYIGINLAAMCAGIEFGLQPLIYGGPVYCPYTIAQAVPAMLFAHLTVAGPVEAIVAALVIRYFQVSDPSLFLVGAASKVQATVKEGFNKLWYIIIALIVLTPIGLLAPGGAWGEWGADEIKNKFGFIPQGMAALRDHWHALLQDYGIPGWGGDNPAFWQSAFGYIISAVVGIAIIVGLTYLFSRLVAAREAADKS